LDYQNIEEVLGQEWLSKNTQHPYSRLISSPPNRIQKLFLSNLDTYLVNLKPVLPRKRLKEKFRNLTEFYDTYYELKVGNLLKDNGFSFSFEHKLEDNLGKEKTPDFFVKEERIIVDVKTLHERTDVMQKKDSGVFKPTKYRLLNGIITSELEKWKNDIKYPLVIITCIDEIEDTAIYPDDYKTVLYGHTSHIKICPDGTIYQDTPDYSGLYYQDKGKTTDKLSGTVRLWKSHMQFFENPNVRKESKIPEGKFLNFLRRCSF
jgi:hypothetical protein